MTDANILRLQHPASISVRKPNQRVQPPQRAQITGTARRQMSWHILACRRSSSTRQGKLIVLSLATFEKGTSLVRTCPFRRESAHLGAAGAGGKTREASSLIFFFGLPSLADGFDDARFRTVRCCWSSTCPVPGPSRRTLPASSRALSAPCARSCSHPP